MQSLSFVFVVHKVQVDPNMSMLTCQTTSRPHYVINKIWGLWIKLWKLHIYVTSRSGNLDKVRWNVSRRICGIFLPLWAVWCVFLRNYFWPDAANRSKGRLFPLVSCQWWQGKLKTAENARNHSGHPGSCGLKQVASLTLLRLLG